MVVSVSPGLKSSKGRAVESLGKEAAEGRREGSVEVRLKSRDDAAFGTLERALDGVPRRANYILIV